MSDLVERLRDERFTHPPRGMLMEAADEIERLRALLDETVRDREDYNGKHQQAVLEIERLTCQLEKMHEAAPNCLFYQEQAEYWRGIAEDTTKQLVTVRRETIEECAKWLEDMPEHWRTLAVEMRRSLLTI